MFQGAMSNSTLSEEASSLSSFNPLILQSTTNNILTPSHQQQQPPTPKKVKKKRSLPGNPDPDAEVIALSPKTLLATNRFICEICNKGFQRDQNLQLHRRGHNLPWKLKQRNKNEIVRKKAYVCPEPTCVHHHPSRALGDLTGIKKHFCRKHGEKKYKCDKCSKIYAVQSDWKAHSKTCGTREYRCDCGTVFSRKDSFITHRAFCDALAEESARFSTNPFSNPLFPPPQSQQSSPSFSTLQTTHQNPNSSLFPFPSPSSNSLSSSPWDPPNPLIHIKTENPNNFSPPPFFQPPHIFTNHSKPTLLTTTTLPFSLSDTAPISSPHPFLSATALLQKASTVGSQSHHHNHHHHPLSTILMNGFDHHELATFSPQVGVGPTPTATTEMAAGFTQVGPTPSTTNSKSTTSTTINNNNNNNNNNDHLSAMLSAWRKSNDGLTRDFLGLTAGDYNTNASDEMVGNMLKFTGGLQYQMTGGYDRDNSASASVLLKNQQQHQEVDHGFGFAETPSASAGSRWG